MSLIKNISKYSHCILGRYEIRPPDENERRRGDIAGLDAEQYYEASSTGGAVPFKFLTELKMTQHGDTLFDAFYASLKVVTNTILARADEYAKGKQIVIRPEDLKYLPEVDHKVALRIRVFVPRVYTDKVDTEILWFVDGDEKGTSDFEKVCDAAGVVTVVLLARELLRPIKYASDAIKHNLGVGEN